MPSKRCYRHKTNQLIQFAAYEQKLQLSYSWLLGWHANVITIENVDLQVQPYNHIVIPFTIVVVVDYVIFSLEFYRVFTIEPILALKLERDYLIFFRLIIRHFYHSSWSFVRCVLFSCSSFARWVWSLEHVRRLDLNDMWIDESFVLPFVQRLHQLLSKLYRMSKTFQKKLHAQATVCLVKRINFSFFENQ